MLRLVIQRQHASLLPSDFETGTGGIHISLSLYICVNHTCICVVCIYICMYIYIYIYTHNMHEVLALQPRPSTPLPTWVPRRSWAAFPEDSAGPSVCETIIQSSIV